MKKLIKKILRFIGRIILFFDKILITPLMKIILKIRDFFKRKKSVRLKKSARDGDVYGKNHKQKQRYY